MQPLWQSILEYASPLSPRPQLTTDFLTCCAPFMLLCRTINDRQAGTLPTRPGRAQFHVMSRNWLAQESCEGLLFRSVFLEQTANAMRGSEIRQLELADRFTMVYDTLSPVNFATAIGSLKMNGKTNQVCDGVAACYASWHVAACTALDFTSDHITLTGCAVCCVLCRMGRRCTTATCGMPTPASVLWQQTACSS